MSSTPNPKTPSPAELHKLKLQMSMQLIDEALHGEGEDVAAREVALQNYVVGLVSQNHQLWQALVALSAAAGVEPGAEDWESRILDAVATAVRERDLLGKTVTTMLTADPFQPSGLSKEEEAEIHRFLDVL